MTLKRDICSCEQLCKTSWSIVVNHALLNPLGDIAILLLSVLFIPELFFLTMKKKIVSNLMYQFLFCSIHHRTV